MSFSPERPNMLAQAASDLEAISTSLSDGSSEASVPTTEVAPAAPDVVSALVAAQFAAHAHVFQAVSKQVAAVQTLLADMFHPNGGSHGGTEGMALPPGANRQNTILPADHDTRPLLAAAAAWEGLAANLQSSAASYASLIGKLTEKNWQDPVSASMAAGATSHVAWLSSFATHAKQAAAQAEHAADWLSDRLFRSA